MSTTLCKFKIISSQIREMNAEDIVLNCYDNREDNFSRWCKLFNIPNTNSRLKIGEFMEMLKEAYSLNPHDFFESSGLNEYYYIQLLSELEKSYDEDGMMKIVPYHTLLWNNIFSELNYKNFKPALVNEIVIEIMQVEPGIRVFPKYTINDTVTKRMERHFLIRILNDIDMGNIQNPISEWFEKNNGDIYPQSGMDFGNFAKTSEAYWNFEAGIIWGFSKRKEIVVKRSNPSFLKKHGDSWWIDHIPEGLEDEDKEYPMKVIQYSIFLHPKWFANLENELNNGDIHDSTAYY